MDLTLWKINGETFEALDIEQPHFRRGNMVDDVFSFVEAGCEFDADLRYEEDADIVLMRGAVRAFRGTVAEAVRNLDAASESVAYTVRGPWSWLGEYTFLQRYRYRSHPEMPSPTVFIQQHSRAVLGQADDGAKISVKQVIIQILTCAIDNGCQILIGAIAGFDNPGVWDEITDFKCDEAIRRTLNGSPDAVVTWDYSTIKPTFNLTRRDAMAEITLKVRPPLDEAPDFEPEGAYAPFESISLTKLTRQLIDTCVVFYRSTDSIGNGMSEQLNYEVAGTSDLVLAIAPLAQARLLALPPALAAENTAMGALYVWLHDPVTEGLLEAKDAARAAADALWATYAAAAEAEAAAVSAAAGSRRALVRTIDLAGARVTVNNVTQPITVKPFYARLVFEAPEHPAPNVGNLIPGDRDFLRVEAFWKRQVDWLGQPGVIVLAFRTPGRREINATEDGVFNVACENELVPGGGGIADWMRDKRGIVDEEQLFSVRVSAKIPVPGAPGTYTQRIADLTARVTATNAQSRLYVYSSGWSMDEAEPRPVNMAAELIRGHDVVHQDGTLTLVEEEATLSMLPHYAINLDCAARPEWAEMRAQAQLVDVDIATGKSKITLGPPKQLNKGDAIETFGINRTRRDIGSSNARGTGLSFS